MAFILKKKVFVTTTTTTLPPTTTTTTTLAPTTTTTTTTIPPADLFPFGIVASNQSGQANLYKTLDSGQNWSTLSLPAELSTGNDVIVYNRNRILLSGNATTGGTYLGISSDEGVSFTPKNFDPPFGYGIVNGLKYDSVNNITYSYARNLLKSTDSGETWTTIINNFGYRLYDVAFIDANTIYAVGFSGGNKRKLNVSTNGGSTWNDIGGNIPSASFDSWSVYFFNSSTGIVGGGDGTGSLVYRTTNGGTSWTDVSSFFDGAGTNQLDVVDIQFQDTNVGYAVEGGGLTTGKIYKTTDGGVTWSKIYDNDLASEYIHKITLIQNNLIYFSTSQGALLRTTDGGSSFERLLVDTPIGVANYLARNGFVE